ncbi:recombinase zinc beta ribbon domain-containing protein [Lamprobacter sp.]|uniref:recombinase zinc beta ribbon domain-containing protein n=1 Tax=Lamprobacter sp. TaxID=3100796 RepID=UPI003A4D5F7F
MGCLQHSTATRPGTGILRKQIYLGRQIWNRSKWVKDPDTGRQTRRERAESEWQISEHPELQIIDADLEQRVERRHALIAESSKRAREAMRNNGSVGPRPRYLLSGLMTCAHCGAPVVSVGGHSGRYGCSAARYRGDAVCDQRTTVVRKRLEQRILSAVREDIYTPDAIDAYRSALLAELQAAVKDSAPTSTPWSAMRARSNSGSGIWSRPSQWKPIVRRYNAARGC